MELDFLNASVASERASEERSRSRNKSGRSQAGQPRISQNGVRDPSEQKSDAGSPTSDHPTSISQEDILQAIRSQLAATETLSKISIDITKIAEDVRTSSTSSVEFVWASVLQLAGLLFVVIFGVFSALAYDAAEVANKQSAEANQMSLLTFCMVNPNIAGGICAQVSQNGLDPLNSLATVILGSTTTRTKTSATTAPQSSSSTIPSSQSTTLHTTTTSTGAPSSTSTISSTATKSSTPSKPSSTSSKHPSAPAIVGYVVGVIFSVISGLVTWCTWSAKFRR